MKTKIKSGDEVVVIAGNARGTRAKVMQVSLKKSRILVEGVNKVKHYEKPNQQGEGGGLIEREAPIHISNVVLASKIDQKKSK
jgi:large subunit ribosomal protein L24